MSIKIQSVKMSISLYETYIARERLVGQSVELSKLLHKEPTQSVESRRHQFLSPLSQPAMYTPMDLPAEIQTFCLLFFDFRVCVMVFH